MNIWSEENLSVMQKNALDVASDKQQAALVAFLSAEKPSRKVEAWKYTNLNDLSATSTIKAASVSDRQINPLISEANTLIFVDGVFDQANSKIQSLPKGVILTDLKSVINEKKHQELLWQQDNHLTLFSDLNNAMLNDGLFLYVPKNTVLENPIHLIYSNTQAGTHHPRHLIILEENAQTKVCEDYVGINDSVYFNNVKTQIIAKQSARLEHYKCQRQGDASFHIANISIQQEKDSVVKTYHFGIGAKLGREDLHFDLKAEHTETELVGFYHAKDNRHLDAHTRVDHAFSHTHSSQCYKTIAADKGTTVFNGKVIVHKDAQKIVAHQQNRNLLLDKTATVNAKPELEIYADDVKCSHGSTIGQLDDNALFYLRSRGIPEKQARELLMQAFVDDVLNHMPENELSCHIIKQINLELLTDAHHD